MSRGSLVPGGRRRPGRDDSGAISVEAAFGIVGLVLVALVLAWCLALLGGELALGAASRAAARVAARGEDAAAVAREAHRLVPEADVTVRSDGRHVVVECRRSVSAPGLLARLGAVHLEARSAATVEQP